MDNDSTDNAKNDAPQSLRCPLEHKPCDKVTHCALRMYGGECGFATATFRKLGMMKRVQQTVMLFARKGIDFLRDLRNIWRDPRDRMDSHDRKYFDKADRD